jgi:hypothetical protein
MVETFFFHAYYAYLKGNLKEAEMYLTFLKEECKLNPGKNKLNAHYLPEFKKVVTAVKTKTLPRQSWLDEPLVQDTPGTKTKLKQDAIVKGIHKQCLDSLRTILGAQDDFYLHNIEHPCEPYGAVDMVYDDKVTCFPLEVKKDRAEHDIIGQIMKYDLCCRLKLHLKHYYKVQPITVCSSYEKFTLSQLKQLKVITIKFAETDGRISLRKI